MTPIHTILILGKAGRFSFAFLSVQVMKSETDEWNKSTGSPNIYSSDTPDYTGKLIYKLKNVR